MSTYIQAATANAYAGTSIGASLTGVRAGHNIRVAVVYGPTSLKLSHIGDGMNTYTDGAAATFGASKMQTAFHPNTPSGNITVTASFSGGTLSSAAILIEEWSGDATMGQPAGTPIAGFVKSTHPGNPLSVGDITTTINGSDIWCVMFQLQAVAPSVGAGFTMASNGLAGGLIYSEYQVQAKAGTITPNWISGTNSYDNFVGAIAFKPSSSNDGCKKGFLGLFGIGCGVWAAEKIEQNPSIRRRDLVIPPRRLLGRRKQLILPREGAQSDISSPCAAVPAPAVHDVFAISGDDLITIRSDRDIR